MRIKKQPELRWLFCLCGAVSCDSGLAIGTQCQYLLTLDRTLDQTSTDPGTGT